MGFELSPLLSAEEQAKSFIEHSDKFKLGELLTEQSHPMTRDLSEWAKNDLNKALDALRELDLSALSALLEKEAQLEQLKEKIQKTLDSGRKVFLSGCGATGRLSLKLEYLWRATCTEEQKEQVVGFMAGGDIAFIRSIESFEDHFSFGDRQLQDLGFQDGDLLIGITEGGETSFVIGATESAARLSKNKPFFIYCNPRDVLIKKVERSRRILENPEITDIDLSHEPMALSGSTRMQATSVQLLAVASALLNSEKSVKSYIAGFVSLLKKHSYEFLSPFIQKEVASYRSGCGVIYSTDEFGMTILTDTTERSPTFSLPCFENFEDQGAPSSLCYFHVEETKTAEDSWNRLLLRAPRTLTWNQYQNIAGASRISGYDFSDCVFEKRSSKTEQKIFKIKRVEGQKVKFSFMDLQQEFDWQNSPLFYQHLMLKLFLNSHSTLIMGQMERYQGNWMTWVKPSNGKLIDRAIRYIQGLAQKQNTQLKYEDVAQEVFRQIPHLKDGEPIVLRVLGQLLSNS